MPITPEGKSELETASFVLTRRQVSRIREMHSEANKADAVRLSLSDVARRVVEAGLNAYPDGLNIGNPVTASDRVAA